MSLFKQFATNKDAETQGVWVEYGPNEDGTVPSFKLARAGKSNEKWAKLLEKATRPHRRALELGRLDNKISDQIFKGVFVEAVLLDWKNVKDRDGNDFPFTRSNALELMNQLPELYDDLSEKASKATLFAEVELEADAKN